MFNHATYISPFTWRYASQEMRTVWSEYHRRLLMRRVWVSLATVQQRAGLVSAEQVEDLRSQVDNVDIERALEIESELHHDIMAEIHTFSEQAPRGGKILHWGATSADITDNVDVLRMKDAIQLLLGRLAVLLDVLATRIEQTAELAVMAYTHIQPAEPTTEGYRFAVYGQDLLEAYIDLATQLNSLRGKGLKGAVGTQASFSELLLDADMTVGEMEAGVMAELDLQYYPVATQTYTRQQDLRVIQSLALLSAALHKFALDFRILQSPPFGEWAEPFAEKQVGSSAMPFKRNPINTENICSLARYVATLPQVMWDNASQAVFERSLDDSANRRIVLAEAFLAADEMVGRFIRIVRDMTIHEQVIVRNMALYGPFAAMERVLMALVAEGADRQQAHDWLRENSLHAWQSVQDGLANPLQELLQQDERIVGYLTRSQVADLMDVSSHTGTASQRASAMAAKIRRTLETAGR